MTEVFRQSFVQATQDHLLDRSELKRLQKTAAQVQNESPTSEDANTAQQVMDYLNQQQSTADISYSLASSKHPPLQVEFSFTPTYTESESVAGSSASEQVSNLSQTDSLSETNDDGNRCGAASMLSAHLLLGGSFSSAAEKLGMPAQQRSMTYQNVHLAQEKLYDRVNTDQESGLSSGFRLSATPEGNILSSRASGEMVSAAQLLGVKLQPLLGDSTESLSERSSAVNSFWQTHPNAVLQVGSTLDENTGELSPPASPAEQNHYVLIQRDGNNFILTNSGVLNNGDGSASRRLTAEEYNRFVNFNPGSVNGLWR